MKFQPDNASFGESAGWNEVLDDEYIEDEEGSLLL